MSGMEPNVDPTVQRLRLICLLIGVTTTGLVVVVRKTKVSATEMQINLMSKYFMSQSTALYVPAFPQTIKLDKN